MVAMLSRNAIVSGGSELLRTIHQRRESKIKFDKGERREGVP